MKRTRTPSQSAKRREFLFLLALGVVAFGLGVTLEPRLQAWAGERGQPQSILQAALGDGRKLFAKHFYTKADVYFHNGYYPTIYDNAADFKEAHMAGGIHEVASASQPEERENFLGKPTDWLDAFSRHFFPSRHTHLGDGGGGGCEHGCCAHGNDGHKCEEHDHDHGHQHDHHQEVKAGEERELLPWLRVAAELDPHRIETYLVASYWLRNKLGKSDEAEQFLREGLQANPGDCEILFELGRIYYEHRDDAARARNVWELSLKQWRTQEAGKEEPNLLVYISILNYLAMLEREQNNYPRAIEYYGLLKEVSPNRESIQSWIEYLKTNGPPIRVGIRAR